MLVASWAMLLDLKAVRIVTTILARDVVAFFAVFACQSNLWTNVVTCHGLAFRLSSYTWCVTGLAFTYRGPDLNRRHSDYEPLALPS